jgi:hypothetical protein
MPVVLYQSYTVSSYTEISTARAAEGHYDRVQLNGGVYWVRVVVNIYHDYSTLLQASGLLGLLTLERVRFLGLKSSSKLKGNLRVCGPDSCLSKSRPANAPVCISRSMNLKARSTLGTYMHQEEIQFLLQVLWVAFQAGSEITGNIYILYEPHSRTSAYDQSLHFALS